MKKKILIAIAFIVAIFGIFASIYMYDSDINNTVSELQDEIIEEIQNVDNLSTTEDVIVSEETEDIVRDTIQATEERRRFINNRNYRKFRRRGRHT